MMRTKHDGALAVRFSLPWWVSFTAAATAYLFCSFLVPSLMSGNPALSRLADWLTDGAPFLAALFVALGTFVFFGELHLRRLRQTQNRLESIRGMDWQDFELLVAEGFRRLGYCIDFRPPIWHFRHRCLARVVRSPKSDSEPDCGSYNPKTGPRRVSFPGIQGGSA